MNIDQLNPFSDYHALEGFKRLSPCYRTLTVVLVALTAIFTIGTCVAPVFREIVNRLIVLDINGKTPYEQIAKKVGVISVPEVVGQLSSKNWKSFLMDELTKALSLRKLHFEKSVENGDCFFDSVSYQLTMIKGRQYTAQEVREDIKNYLKRDDVDHEKYQGLLKKYYERISYEKFRADIGVCADGESDRLIWGDQTTAQIVSDMYSLPVRIFSKELIGVGFDDLSGEYVNYNYVKVNDIPYICTQLREIVFEPLNPNSSKEEIVLAQISNVPWGHFVPVVPGG